jgi:hypothetical protein
MYGYNYRSQNDPNVGTSIYNKKCVIVAKLPVNYYKYNKIIIINFYNYYILKLYNFNILNE